MAATIVSDSTRTLRDVARSGHLRPATVEGREWRVEFAADGVNAILSRWVPTPAYSRGLRMVAGGLRTITIRRPLDTACV
jgi:hypothetical protein